MIQLRPRRERENARLSGYIPIASDGHLTTINTAMDVNAEIWSENQTLDVVMRVLLALAGFNVAGFWLGLGVLSTIDIWSTPMIDLSETEWVPLIGGLVLGVWTLLGVIKATVVRFMPPAMVAFPAAVIGLAQVAFYTVRY